MAEGSTEVEGVLRETFGFDRLRPGQEEVVAAVMAGRDTLAIMPTGGGKSLCYQLPALCREGLTIVVSPLIALMKDQVDALQGKGIRAAAVNSSLGADEYRQVLQTLKRGDLKILYVAPERFAQEGFMRILEEQEITLMAVDEAHCLSQWGHDFRPDYLKLGRVRVALGSPPIVALTATATDIVRTDIIEALRLKEPAVIVRGFARANLNFAVSHCDGKREKLRRIQVAVEKWKKGIIYCSTRKNVMTVFEHLSMAQVNAVAYHAGMTDEEREYSQNAFISGQADVVVATNAFGMGIDRPDVRFVIHYEIPGSVEAYYQEAGRAGRDGEEAHCELLFNHADLKTQEFFFEAGNPGILLIRSLYNMLLMQGGTNHTEVQLTVDEMAQQLGRDVNPMAVGSALSVLMHAGAILRTDVPGRNIKSTRIVNGNLPFNSLNIDRARLEEKAKRDHKKIEAVTNYAYSMCCRQKWILDYFGEKGTEACGHCDICRAQAPADACELRGKQAQTVIKALSGIARSCAKNADGTRRALYGRSKIMAMLQGSKSTQLTAHLMGLSTYGILSGMSRMQLRALFSAMQEAGYIESTGGELPLIRLSARGEDTMRGKIPVVISTSGWAADADTGATQKQTKRSAETSPETTQNDAALYTKLTAVRAELAHAYNLPLYRIMSNATLRELCALHPTTEEEAMNIKGIGTWTRQHTLRSFLDVIRNHQN